MLYPKIGIRPVIDGRWGGVRESLENQTMRMAENAAKLISENLKYPDGTPVQCVCGQNRSQIHRAGALGAIEAPDCLNGVGVHVERLSTIAPTGGHGQCGRNILGRELLCHAGRLLSPFMAMTCRKPTMIRFPMTWPRKSCALPVVLLTQAG